MNLKNIKNRITGIFTRTKKYSDISFEEIEEVKQRNPIITVVDVRSPQEYQEGHLNNAINIPHYEIKEKATKQLLNKQTPILVYCQSGARSSKSAQILSDMGYEQVYNVLDGLNARKS